jgi:hypothetical protein
MSGLATIVDWRDTSNKSIHKGSCPGDSPGPLWELALSVRAIIGHHAVPVSIQRRDKMASLNDSSPDLLFRLWFLTFQMEEPWVVLTVEKPKVIFLFDSEVLFSVIPFSPGPGCNNKVRVQGISGQPLEQYFIQPLACSWGDLCLCHLF